MDHHDIDMESLISLVEDRPVLWDKTTESYKNKQLNFTAWKEICVILNEKFETLPDKEKNEFGKQIMKKWNNARDNWMRCTKKMKECKTGSKAKSIQKYNFFEQMQFLNKIAIHRPTATNMPPAPDAEETVVKDDSTVPKNRRKKDETEKDELSRRITSLVDSVEKEENSRIMSFFRGIAPTIEKFNDADIVEFQYEVIKTMRNIHQRNVPPYYPQMQPPNHYYGNSTPAPYYSSHLAQPSSVASAPYYSQRPHIAQNINTNRDGGYRTTASTSYTNYDENESSESPEYETLEPTGRFSSTAERPVVSVDSQESTSCFDFDFAESPQS